MYDEIPNKKQENIPSISYFQTEEYGSYGSSYDSRGDIFDQTKQQPAKLTLGQSETNPRLSVSSQITIIDEPDNNLFNNRLSPIMNNDDTILSTNSTSPTDQSMIISTNDYPTRSIENFIKIKFIFPVVILAARLPHSSLFWPRKGQTLDNYIRECDLKTGTDVEKVQEIFPK
jgi:hypothetical protein